MVSRWNWLRLLNYCLSRVLAISLLIAVVLVGGALAFAHGQSVKVPRRNNIRQSGITYQPISGVITDAECGARHNKDANMSAMECARFCVRNGSKYILIDGEKRYTLSGNAEEISKLAGQRVTISGSRNGDTVVVNSLRMQE
jgi:Mg-chelatase subunit ChlD